VTNPSCRILQVVGLAQPGAHGVPLARREDDQADMAVPAAEYRIHGSDPCRASVGSPACCRAIPLGSDQSDICATASFTEKSSTLRTPCTLR